jgi:hypothetical protein
LSASNIDAARRIAKWADERYFDLKERGVDGAVWDNWFRKARLASAIHVTFRESSWESCAGGLYELSVIFGDLADFLASFKEGMESAHRLTSLAKGSLGREGGSFSQKPVDMGRVDT